jgi:hypothetical protein
VGILGAYVMFRLDESMLREWNRPEDEIEKGVHLSLVFERGPRLDLFRGTDVIGARGGPILTGRFNPGDGVRSTTGSWEFGGLAAAQVEFLRIEATAFRMDGRNAGDHTPVDVGRGTFCAVAGKLGICGDFMALQGAANMGGPAGVNMQDALVTYMGVTIGASRW